MTNSIIVKRVSVVFLGMVVLSGVIFPQGILGFILNPNSSDSNANAATTTSLVAPDPVITVAPAGGSWSNNVSNVKPGDTIKVRLSYKNSGSVTAYNVQGSVTVYDGGTTAQVGGGVWADNAPKLIGAISVNAASGQPAFKLVYQSSILYKGPNLIQSGSGGGPNNYSFGDAATSGDTCSGQLVITYKVEAVTTTPPPTTNQEPIGVHDSFSGTVPQDQCFAIGWATDPDDKSRDLTVKLYIDDSLKASMTASQYRSDLLQNNACPNGTCGFGFNLWDKLTHNQFHTIKVTAVDLSGTFEKTLTNSPKNIICTDTVVPPSVCAVANTLPANPVADTAAVFNAQINPNGSATEYWFIWGTTTSNLGLDGRNTNRYNISGGSSFQNVSVPAYGLQPNTTYYYRVIAKNGCGQEVLGNIVSFTTSGGGPIVCPVVQTVGTNGVSSNSANLTGRVNPNGHATTYRFEYGKSPSLLSSFTTFQSAGSGSGYIDVTRYISGLSANTTYYFRIVATSDCGTITGSILSFVTNPPTQVIGNPPSVETLPATNITQTSATLNGRVNPNGFSTSYRFEYGTSPTALNSYTTFQSAGSGTSFVNVSQSINGLSPNTTYYFRIVANNPYGNAQGSILQFTTPGNPVCTPPQVETLSATGDQTSATITARINANGTATTYRFEYGTSPSGLNQYTIFKSVGSGSGYVTVSENIANLSPNTAYYYRVVAQSSCGAVNGTTLLFTTGSNGQAPLVETLPATNVTETSAMLNGRVNANGYITSYRFEYGTSQSALTQFTTYQSVGSGTSFVNVSQFINGLSPNTTYYFRIVANNPYGNAQGSILQFTTPGGGSVCDIQVNTISFSNLTESSVTLNATVNPGTSSGVSYRFEYGTSPSSFSQYTNYQSVSGSGSVSQTIYNLSYNTTYYFRVVAQGSNCPPVYGSVLTFTTGNVGQQPQAETLPATGVTETSATLNGRVNPNGYITTYRFEYGTSQYSLNQVTTFQSVGSGNSYVNVNQYISGLQSNTTYYFRIIAQNQYGTAQGQILSFTTTGGGYQYPTLTISPTTIVTNISSCSSQYFSVYYDPDGPSGYQSQQNVTSMATWNSSNYSIARVNTGGQVSCSAQGTVTVIAYYNGLNANGTVTVLDQQQPGQAPIAHTLPATGIGQNSATLNGEVDPNGNLTSYRFEYGRTTALGNVTPFRSAGSIDYNFPVSESISGLSSYTTYYFRVVAQNAYGISYGAILSFRTLGTYIPPTPPVPPQPIVPAVAVLGAIDRIDTICPTIQRTGLSTTSPLPGDEITYSVRIQNGGTATIKKVVLKVTIPPQTDFISSTVFPTSQIPGTLMFNLPDIPAGGQNLVSIKVRVRTDTPVGTVLTFNTTLDYTDRGVQLTAIGNPVSATVVPVPVIQDNKASTTFFASIGDAFGSIPGYVWLFLFLLLIILLISAFLFRSLNERRSGDVIVTNP